MANYDISIPGIAGHVSLAPPGVFVGAKLLVDGQPAPAAGRGKFWLTGLDGSRVEAKLAGTFGAYLPAIVVGGVRHQAGPKLPAVLVVLAFLPFLLVFGGGLLGGVCGAIGWSLNNHIARGSWPMAGRVAAMLAVTVVFGITFAVVAVLFRTAIAR
jgi:hypothetical protein